MSPSNEGLFRGHARAVVFLGKWLRAVGGGAVATDCVLTDTREPGA